jgi:hypothetical protein
MTAAVGSDEQLPELRIQIIAVIRPPILAIEHFPNRRGREQTTYFRTADCKG